MSLDKISDQFSKTLKNDDKPKKIEEQISGTLSYDKKMNARHFRCENCKTIVPRQVFLGEDEACPKCGNTLDPMFEDVSMEEKRYNCPKCTCSFLYEAAMSQNCPVCSGYMDVYAPLRKTK